MAREAFYGGRRLMAALPIYGTRELVLEAYARIQGETFGMGSVGARGCEFCEGSGVAAAVMVVEWTATVRYRRKALAWFVLCVPLILPLALNHLTAFLLAYVLKDLKFVDRIGFVTVHPVCGRCAKGLRVRRLMFDVFLFFYGFLGVTSGIAGVILGAVVLAMVVSAFGLRPGDAAELLPWLGLSVLLTISAVAARRLVERPLLVPWAVGGLVRRPFRYWGHKVRGVGEGGGV